MPAIFEESGRGYDPVTVRRRIGITDYTIVTDGDLAAETATVLREGIPVVILTLDWTNQEREVLIMQELNGSAAARTGFKIRSSVIDFLTEIGALTHTERSRFKDTWSAIDDEFVRLTRKAQRSSAFTRFVGELEHYLDWLDPDVIQTLPH